MHCETDAEKLPLRVPDTVLEVERDCDGEGVYEEEKQALAEKLEVRDDVEDTHTLGVADSHWDTELERLPLGVAEGERVGERVCDSVTVLEEDAQVVNVPLSVGDCDKVLLLDGEALGEGVDVPDGQVEALADAHGDTDPVRLPLAETEDERVGEEEGLGERLLPSVREPVGVKEARVEAEDVREGEGLDERERVPELDRLALDDTVPLRQVVAEEEAHPE